MARNIDNGDGVNYIPFNCYKSHINDRGRLIKDDEVFDRIYCRVENKFISRSNVNNVIRAGDVQSTIITNSPNELQEDYYIENTYTNEVWKIDTIMKNPISNDALENNRRVHYETRMVCSR